MDRLQAREARRERERIANNFKHHIVEAHCYVVTTGK